VNLCRCPHCESTFQVSIPHDAELWDQAPTDEDGLLLWVCLDCRKQGMPDVPAAELRAMGHDRSFRPGPA